MSASIVVGLLIKNEEISVGLHVARSEGQPRLEDAGFLKVGPEGAYDETRLGDREIGILPFYDVVD